MNKEWVVASHKSAEFYRSRERYDLEKGMEMIRILDATGMFETGWLVFKHSHNNKYNRFGYPYNEKYT